MPRKRGGKELGHDWPTGSTFSRNGLKEVLHHQPAFVEWERTISAAAVLATKTEAQDRE